MKKTLIATVALLSVIAAPAAFADVAKTAPHPQYSTDETPIGDLLDNKDTHSVLEKYLPAIVQSDQIDMARSMTLRQIQQYAPDDISDKTLAEVDAALSALPAKQ